MTHVLKNGLNIVREITLKCGDICDNATSKKRNNLRVSAISHTLLDTSLFILRNSYALIPCRKSALSSFCIEPIDDL